MDYFSQYVTEDFKQYINRKRSDHCYGNNLEMQAIAEMYNRTIEVFQYGTGMGIRIGMGIGIGMSVLLILPDLDGIEF